MRRFVLTATKSAFLRTELDAQSNVRSNLVRQFASGLTRNQAASSGTGDGSKKGIFSGLKDSIMSKSQNDQFTRQTRSQQQKGGTFTATQVKHDKKNRKLTLDLGGDQVAWIDYKEIGPNKVEMFHTEVPARMRGRGIGKVLARGALESMANSNMKVRVTCNYLMDYVNKYASSKLKDIVEK